MDVAAASAAVWTMASAATGFFVFQTIYLQPLTLDDRFGQVLGTFLTQTALGQAWLVTGLVAAILTALCFAVRNQVVIVFLLFGAVAGLAPMALQGHSGNTASHDAATSALWLHIVFAALWLGGLVTLTIVGKGLVGASLRDAVSRYSTVALVSFVVVAASGYVGAEIRVGTLGNVFTPYGILVLVKVGVLVVLGIFGAYYRRSLIKRMAPSAGRAQSAFWWLVCAELVFMGIASGVAAALARTATPQPEVPAAQTTNPTAAEILTGAPLPPPLTTERLFTMWNFDLIWMLICGFGIFFYLAGARRLHKRGDSWPVLRTVLWVSGLTLLFFITNGGINAYEKYLFSAHMGAHMVLGMMVPVLLVPAAPITLALRAIHKRHDTSRGVREWIMLLVHSRYFAVLAHPVVAAVIFAASLWVFYYSPLFRWATTDHIGHQWMIIHFLLTGYIFVQSLIGVDPGPARVAYPIRLLVLFATMAFHAFFGLSLMTGSGLLLADWYGAMGWGTSALADQQAGGGIAWSVGEIPTLTLAIIVAVMWSRDDERKSKRYDRKADRDGDEELADYNAMLAKREAASVRRGGRLD
jgi:putative copper resistance protein D